MKKEDQELTPEERECFKCKRVVNKKDFNEYYQICDDCVDNSTGH